MKQKVFLIGMMGAGKSTIGFALATRLGWAWFDSDAQVESATGKTVVEIFEEQGEQAFRKQESIALQKGAEYSSPVVVSVAGGAVLDPNNRKLLADSGAVVWLRATSATIVKRVGTGHGRPLLQGDIADDVSNLYQLRAPLYEQTAALIVDVDDRPVSQIVDEIEQWLLSEDH